MDCQHTEGAVTSVTGTIRRGRGDRSSCGSAVRLIRPLRFVVGALVSVVALALGFAAEARAQAERTPDAAAMDCSARRLEAEERIKTFDKGGDGADDAAKEAGDIYMALWRSRGEGPIRAGKAPECRALDEVLYNAAKAYQAAGMLPQATAARSLLIDNQRALGGTELASKAMYENGGVSQAIGEYEQAAVWFERFARESPKNDRAPEATTDALILRLALGQVKEANDDAQRFLKTYGAKQQEMAARVVLAIAADRLERRDFKAAAAVLRESMSTIGRGAVDVRLRAMASFGQALAGSGDEAEAEKQYKGVLSLFRDPNAERALLNGVPETELRRLGQALNAVGEAHFFLAEIERKKVMAERIPTYKGPADVAAMKLFMLEKTAPALVKRRHGIEEVEARYMAITRLTPAPPPKWVIAAASAVAGMWSDTYEQGKTIEITGAPAKGQDAAASARKLINDALDVYRQRAKAASKTCLMMSVKFQFTSEHAERCVAWLSRYYPEEFPRINELAPRLRLGDLGGGRGEPVGKPRPHSPEAPLD